MELDECATEAIKEGLKNMFSIVQDMSLRGNSQKKVFKLFISSLYQPSVLNNSCLSETVLNMTNIIMTKMAVTKPFAVTLVAQQLLKCFSSMAPTSAAVEALVPVLVFSSAELREVRLLRDSLLMIRENSSVEVIFPNNEFEFYETSMLSEGC